jgi:integrase
VEAGRQANGRRRYLRSVRSTEAEANKALRELWKAADSGVTVDNSRTVATYLDWWADNVLRGTVKATTEADYRNVLRLYVVPNIGHVRLGKLTPAHVQKMMRNLEDAGLSPRTRQYARAVLVRALRWADQSGMIARNPASIVDGPRLARAARLDDALTADEARQVLDHARQDRLYALAVVVLRLGLRRGEALALRWDHVDLDTGDMQVVGTLKEAKGGRLYVDTPKTAAGTRTLPLLPELVAALKDHRKRQATERLAAGPLWRDTGYVFTTEQGEPIPPRFASKWWPALTDAAGIGRRRLHASRHTAATLMLDQGVPLEVVSAILGHASLTITADVYAKVTQDAKRRALSAVDLSRRA